MRCVWFPRSSGERGLCVYMCLEYCVAPYQVVMRVPEGMDVTQAAGLREYISWQFFSGLCVFVDFSPTI